MSCFVLQPTGSPSPHDGTSSEASKVSGIDNAANQSKLSRDTPSPVLGESSQSDNTSAIPTKSLKSVQENAEQPKLEPNAPDQKPESVAGKIEVNKPAAIKIETQKDQNGSDKSETTESSVQIRSEVGGMEEKEKQKTDKPRQPVVLNPVLRHKSQPDVTSIEVLEKALKPDAQILDTAATSENTATQPTLRKFIVQKVDERQIETSPSSEKESSRQRTGSSPPPITIGLPVHSSAKEPVPAGDNSSCHALTKDSTPLAVPSSFYSVQTQTSFGSNSGKGAKRSPESPNVKTKMAHNVNVSSGIDVQSRNETPENLQDTKLESQKTPTVTRTNENDVKSTGRFTITKPVESTDEGEPSLDSCCANAGVSPKPGGDSPQKTLEDLSTQKVVTERSMSSEKIPEKKLNTDPTRSVPNAQTNCEPSPINGRTTEVSENLFVSLDANSPRRLSEQTGFDVQSEQLKLSSESESDITLQDFTSSKLFTPSLTPSSSLESLNSVSSQQSSTCHQSHSSYSPQTIDPSSDGTQKSQHLVKQHSLEELKLQSEWVSCVSTLCVRVFFFLGGGGGMGDFTE